jgi:hypothetical protein
MTKPIAEARAPYNEQRGMIDEEWSIGVMEEGKKSLVIGNEEDKSAGMIDPNNTMPKREPVPFLSSLC